MNPLNGGPCQGIRNLDRRSRRLDIHREVVSLDDPSSSFLGQDDFPIHALGSGITPWRYNSNLVPWLVKNLARFDAVIINGLWLYPSYAVWKAVQHLQKSDGKQPRIFVMPHGMLDPWFQEVNGRQWKSLRNWGYWKLIENRVVNDADGILFTCETELLLARKPFRPYHPKREINVGYGVDEPLPYKESMKTAFLETCPEIENHPYLLFMSRIHYKKGVDLLIKAYATILQSRQSLQLSFPKLVIAGPGLDTPYGERIQQLVNETPSLKGMVSFPGMLMGDAKWGALFGCDAFILPSHQENFGIAVAEALACQKPVLITDQVNIWREIDQEGGGLISSDTLEGTIKSLEQWISLPTDTQKQMGERARITFQKYFQVDQAAIRILNALTLN